MYFSALLLYNAKVFAGWAQQWSLFGESFYDGIDYEDRILFSRPDNYRDGFYVCVFFM